MNIAMFTNTYKPFIGGVPISIERLADGLRKNGNTVYIFAPTYSNENYDEWVVRCNSLSWGLNDKELVFPNIFDPAIAREFKNLNERVPFDVIHVHHPMIMGNVALRLANKYDIPVVFTYHTRYEHYLHHIKFFHSIERRQKAGVGVIGLEKSILNGAKEYIPKYVSRFANKCDMVFAPTDLIKSFLKEMGTEVEIQVMPTGLEESYFEGNLTIAHELRNRYIGEKKFLFCTVSRLTEEKNIDFILEGLYNVKKRIGDVFNVMVVGEGPLKSALIDKAKKLGIDGNVVFIGSVDNNSIGNYYRASDLFLFASKSETQGIVLLEAMAAEIPVVAVKATGVVDVVVDGTNGFMTDEDVDKWAEKVVCITQNREEYEELKRGALSTAKKYLNSDIALIAENNYSKVIKRHCDTSYIKKLWKGISTIRTRNF